MSLHSFPKIDQKEYLKKYLSGDKSKKKKKDKKHKKPSKDSSKVKIIDDDAIHLDSDGPQVDEELLLTGEDAPQIVGEYIEVTPVDRKVPKWKSIVIKDEPEENGNRSSRHSEENLWGRKAGDVRIKQEFSKGEKCSTRTPDNSPHRRKNRIRKSSTSSPPRRRRKSTSITRSPKRGESSRQNRESNDSLDRRVKIKTEPLSPRPRKRKNSDQSPPRKKQNGSSRDSPPTRNARSFEQSPLRRQRNQTPDNSPRRRRRNSSHSPPKTKKPVNRTSDTSPDRRKRDYYSSPSNSARRRRKSSDQSPPRKLESSKEKGSEQPSSRGRSPDQSPPRRRQNTDKYSQQRHRRDSDQSPARGRRQSCERKNRRTPDNSPPRKSRKDSDSSPPRRRRNSDQSPPRRKGNGSSDARIKREKQTPDLSPRPARQSRWGEKQKPEGSQSPPPTHKPKPGKTLEGKKAGLQSAQALQKETTERRKREDVLFEEMSSEISGRHAEVQVRSTGRKGRRAREAADEDPEERRRKEEYEEKKKQQYDRWGKGLKQIEDHKNRMIEQEYESSKPLARYANDEDLERHLREQERAEDPMLEYMRQKRKEKEKKSGKPEVPRYKGSYPENRFGIAPGYRWDGVDRSNGYEKKYFAVQNEKQARQDEAYKYSVEDM